MNRNSDEHLRAVMRLPVQIPRAPRPWTPKARPLTLWERMRLVLRRWMGGLGA